MERDSEKMILQMLFEERNKAKRKWMEMDIVGEDRLKRLEAFHEYSVLDKVYQKAMKISLGEDYD